MRGLARQPAKEPLHHCLIASYAQCHKAIGRDG